MKFPLQLAAIVLGSGLLVYWLLNWLGGQGEPVDPASLTPEARGLALVEARGCVACHSLDGRAGIGPSWAAAWGAQRRLADGRVVSVDEDYLRRAMADPAAELVEGFDPVMLPAAFTEAELADVVALIRSLAYTPSP